MDSLDLFEKHHINCKLLLTLLGGLVVFLFLIFVAPLHASAATYYIAANGSDSNNGLATSTPMLHAPGMPNCIATCASITPQPGDSFIFRGGDTWHFGNSSTSPYTGGTWNWTWDGSASNCDTSDNPSAVRTSCIYVGVNKNWYSGSSWTRPIMTGDNPTSTTAVASCAYGNVGPHGQFLQIDNDHYAWFDDFEWTGMCQSTAAAAGNNYLFNYYLYIVDAGGSTYIDDNIISNMYFHGWTHVPFSCSDTSGEPVGQCFTAGAITLGTQSTYGPGNVCDGWDSDPKGHGCLILGGGYLVYGNVFANMSQLVVNGYHDWHDNYWFNYYSTGDDVAHGNSFESNDDAPVSNSSGQYQPAVPFNVFYNNILGHNASDTNGAVKLWFTPNDTAAEYYFNNIVYDQGLGNNWDISTESGGTAGQFMFNNTVDVPAPGAINCSPYLTATGNHLIVDGGSAFASGSCTLSSNVSMTHATAVAQGYMALDTGTSGNNSETTCANDTTPCAPPLASNSTVGAGANVQSYCTTLLGSNTLDGGDIVRAGIACQSATTDACTYNTSNNTVNCPRETVSTRPTTGAWDAGAYQYALAISTSFSIMLTGGDTTIGSVLFL